MNGAEYLTRTLLASGIDTCFANPGTSEMHFVAALDRHPEMRCVLGLFEGVVTGAADGYARMAGKPAATLLHLGPGLGNALANLHNAKKARTPMVTVVGDHASFHIGYESPLKSDVAGVATPMSDWVRSAPTAESVGALAREAVSVASGSPGKAATLILPADSAWNEVPATDASGAAITVTAAPPSPAAPDADPAMLRAAIEALRGGQPTVIYLGGAATLEHNALAVGRISAATGCKLLSTLYVPRMSRGAGRVAIDRIPYPPAPARAALAPYRNVIVLGTNPPVSFFGYPGEESQLQAPGARLINLGAEIDVARVLAQLTDALGCASVAPALVAPSRVPLPASGRLTARAVNEAIGALMPENAILIDEMVTSADGMLQSTAGAPPHDILRLTGGAIGIGIPMAAGAAVACPDRKVIAMQADGSGMYTVQGLWTQARERLDVVTVIYANRGYKILHGELKGVGAGEPGVNARRMLDFDDPALDWVALAKGMGVPGAAADTTEQFCDLLRSAVAGRGPFLIEARI